MLKPVFRFSSLALLGAAALGVGCGSDDAARSPTDSVELQLVPCGSSANEIKGCVAKTGGALRVIGARASCSLTETTLCWSQSGPSGHDSLSVVTNLAEGDASCLAGGSLLQVGVDDDGDGTLEGTEVDGTATVCNGGGVVVRSSHAPWGGTCARGGMMIESGVDDDGDGVLDNPEVDQTEYVCNRYFVQVASGYGYTCATLSDGTGMCWGDNDSGQLGDGTQGTAAGRGTPVPVSGLNGVAEISAGTSHTCARMIDGTARCWGLNSVGQLGNGTGTSSNTPVVVSGLTGVAEITVGTAHSCARLTDGTVKCWGNSENGELGMGSLLNTPNPVSVSNPSGTGPLTGVAQIAAGYTHTCAVMAADGSVYCWGLNTYGGLGNGTTDIGAYPVPVTGLTGAVEVTVGNGHTCARMSDGGARCWGRNIYGQLGDSTTMNQYTPVTVALSVIPDVPPVVNPLSGVAEISAGSFHTCARLTNGTARCWGRNLRGGLGDGTSTDSALPKGVNGLDFSSALAAGRYHNCSLQQDGTLRCWGSNLDGQLGDGTTTESPSPIPVLFYAAP